MFNKIAIFLFIIISFSFSTVTHSTATRDSLARTILQEADSANYSFIVLTTSADAPLDTIILQNPAFSKSGAVLTCLGVPISSTAAVQGTIAKFKMCKKNGSTIISGTVTVTGGGGDMTVDNTSVTVGQTVRLTGFTYTAAP